MIFAVLRLLRGIRTRDRLMMASGATAVFVAWRSRSHRELLHSEELEFGEKYVVEMKPRK